MGINTLGDLTRVSESELLASKNFGETSLHEIREILSAKGLRLGMRREEVLAGDEWGGKREYDYTRSGNPTRDQLAAALAAGLTVNGTCRGS